VSWAPVHGAGSLFPPPWRMGRAMLYTQLGECQPGWDSFVLAPRSMAKRDVSRAGRGGDRMSLPTPRKSAMLGQNRGFCGSNGRRIYLPFRESGYRWRGDDVQYSSERGRGAPCGGSDRCSRMTYYSGTE
jgi:hypothetical protein